MTIHTQSGILVANGVGYVPCSLTKEYDMLGCEPFTPEQEKTLIAYWRKRRYAERNIAILTFGIQTGFRISEILCLKRGDLIKNGNMVDRVYMRRYNMKGGKGEKSGGTHGRAMLLMKGTKKALKAQMDYMAAKGYTNDDDYVFQTQRGGNRPLNGNGFWRCLWDAKKKLGWTWKLGTHSMRKTFAKRIYDNLLDSKNCDALRILQAGLGHKNINNTIKYLSFNEGALIEAMHAVFGGEE